ncbi:MAG: hypothetical protein AAFX10_01630 [Pseudomonadota bacterium]
MPSRLLATGVLLAALSVTASCAQTKSWLDRVSSGKDDGARSDDVVLGAPEAEEYLVELERLATGDPATQIEIFADAESRSTLTPDPSTNLRFALVLATPGHTEYDPSRAQSMLRELLANTALMTRSEVALARIYLRSVEETLILAAETRRLRQSDSRAARTEERAISQRLASVEAENRQLRSDLEEAENKLEAITSIEQALRDQEQTPE